MKEIKFEKTTKFFRDLKDKNLKITKRNGYYLYGKPEEVVRKNILIGGDWIFIPDIIKVEVKEDEI